MIKKIGLVLGGLVVLAIAVLAVGVLVTQPEKPADDSPAANWLQPGTYAVAHTTWEFEDTRRPTSENNSYPGSPARLLPSNVWYPADATDERPLVIYSHGFMSNKSGGTYIAQALASHGYVVVAPDFPLTNGSAPGGPLVTDVTNQPGDVSHIIDQMLVNSLGLGIDGIDDDRIGVAGLSLGGLTSTLAGYHPRWRDPRIDAVVSIAGPAYMFAPEFFRHGSAPFLMIAGTLDAIVEYPANASVIPARVPGAGLVTITGGSHVGFADIAEPYMRLAHNADELGCTAILANVDIDAGDNPFTILGSADEGVVFPAEIPPLCGVSPLPESIHPGRQHMITQMAVLSFFESHFATRESDRAAARVALEQGLAASFAEAAVAFNF